MQAYSFRGERIKVKSTFLSPHTFGELAIFYIMKRFVLLRCTVCPDKVGQMLIGGVTNDIRRLPPTASLTQVPFLAWRFRP